MTDADLFRFEVPTSRGKFVVIGPDTLPPDEAARIGAQIARLLPLMVLEPDVDLEPDDAPMDAETVLLPLAIRLGERE